MDEGRYQPPESITLGLEEALDLLEALEAARATFLDNAHLAGAVEMQVQIQLLANRLGFAEGGWDADDL